MCGANYASVDENSELVAGSAPDILWLTGITTARTIAWTTPFTVTSGCTPALSYFLEVTTGSSTPTTVLSIDNSNAASPSFRV